MLHTREFEVELKNCETEKIMENKIAAHLYSQLDDEGSEILKYKGIIGHNKYGSTLTKQTGFTVIKVGHNNSNPTTRVWNILVEWLDETTVCMDLKDAILIELDEYAVANKIDDYPAFAW